MTYIIKFIWAKFFFNLCLLPVRIIHEEKFDPKQQYIFCANHFSYLDIPLMGFTYHDFVFVGKSSLAKIPLFGYMFKKLHITVDRSSFRDRHKALLRSKEAIEQGRSLLIFPEGGILTSNPPEMARFKDGAFRTAIEKQISIIPVTIPYNWILLPDESVVLNRRASTIVYHKPIVVKGMTMEDLETLKMNTFAVIDSTLKKYNREN